MHFDSISGLKTVRNATENIKLAEREWPGVVGLGVENLAKARHSMFSVLRNQLRCIDQVSLVVMHIRLTIPAVFQHIIKIILNVIRYLYGT